MGASFKVEREAGRRRKSESEQISFAFFFSISSIPSTTPHSPPLISFSFIKERNLVFFQNCFTELGQGSKERNQGRRRESAAQGKKERSRSRSQNLID